MAEKKEEIKDSPSSPPHSSPKQVPSPPPPPPPSPETKEGGKYLQSQIMAIEAEIVSLRADNVMLESDKDELQESLKKLQHTVRNADDTSEILKTENHTLILEVKKSAGETAALTEEVKNLKTELLLVKEQLKNSKATEEQAVSLSNQHQRERAMLIEGSKARVKELLNEQALEIGKIKRKGEEDIQELIQQHSSKTHESEQNFRQHKNTMEDNIEQLKETITNQANRITSYEATIERLDSENNRLRVSQEINTRNRLTVSERNEIEAIKQKSNDQAQDIQRLQHALNLFTINSHQEYRGIIGD